MSEHTLKCSDCGASLAAPAGQDRVICQYCGSETLLEQPVEVRPTPPSGRGKKSVGTMAAVLGGCFFACAGCCLSGLLHPNTRLGSPGPAAAEPGPPHQSNPPVLLALVGVAMLGGAGYFVFRDVQVNVRFVRHKCVVLSKALRESSDGDHGATFRPDVLIEYTVDGRTYREWAYDIGKTYSSGRGAKLRALERFQVTREYPCWYDPDSPDRVVLVRGYSWLAYLILGGCGLFFVLVGVGTIG